MVKLHHPDKAHKLGISKEDAEKKMASVNEAYEVLSDPELKARYDQGDDPNDHEQQRQHPFHGSPFGHQGGHGGQQFQFKFQGGFPFG
jgi:DnaJ family protein C protein 3